MSNCVQVHSTLVLSLKDFDIDRLISDMNLHGYVNEPGFDKFFAPEATDEEFYFYWFVGDNIMAHDDNEVHINFGRHRSSHTNRDLQGTVRFLSRYFFDHALPQSHSVYVTDEFDGFQEMYTEQLTFEKEQMK